MNPAPEAATCISALRESRCPLSAGKWISLDPCALRSRQAETLAHVEPSLMPDHREVEERSLAMARAIVARIDADPDRCGLTHARRVLERWLAARPCPALREWERILQRSWTEIREVLLDPSEEGRRLRQSDPFCGILTPQERWEFYRASH